MASVTFGCILLITKMRVTFVLLSFMPQYNIKYSYIQIKCFKIIKLQVLTYEANYQKQDTWQDRKKWKSLQKYKCNHYIINILDLPHLLKLALGNSRTVNSNKKYSYAFQKERRERKLTFSRHSLKIPQGNVFACVCLISKYLLGHWTQFRHTS